MSGFAAALGQGAVEGLGEVVFVGDTGVPCTSSVCLSKGIRFVNARKIKGDAMLHTVLFFCGTSARGLNVPMRGRDCARCCFPCSGSCVVCRMAARRKTFYVLDFGSVNHIYCHFVSSPCHVRFFISRGHATCDKGSHVHTTLSRCKISCSHVVCACSRCHGVLCNGKTNPRVDHCSLVRDGRCRGVPHAVRGILLGSGLSTRFVGGAVVSSVGRSRATVSLGACGRRLGGFRAHLHSVRRFRGHRARGRTGRVASLSTRMSHRRATLIRNYHRLTTACHLARDRLPGTRRRGRRTRGTHATLLAHHRRLRRRSHRHYSGVRRTLTVLGGRLRGTRRGRGRCTHHRVRRVVRHSTHGRR